MHVYLIFDWYQVLYYSSTIANLPGALSGNFELPFIIFVVCLMGRPSYRYCSMHSGIRWNNTQISVKREMHYLVRVLQSGVTSMVQHITSQNMAAVSHCFLTNCIMRSRSVVFVTHHVTPAPIQYNA